jgi:hypothetical protein
LVHAIISVATLTISLDPQPLSEDRSCSGRLLLAPIFEGRRSPFADRAADANLSTQLKLVQQTRHFHFVGRANRQVIFSTEANSLDDARQKFESSGHSANDALFIIKTETEIYLC